MFAPSAADKRARAEALAQRLKSDMQIEGRLVVTTARSLAPANTPAPLLADTG